MATIAEQLTSLANTKTAIKNAIVAKGVSVADTDTFASYATKIGEISGSGGGEVVNKTKFGMTVDDCMGEIDANGALTFPTTAIDLDFTGVQQINIVSCFAYRWAYSRRVKTVSFPDLTYLGAVSIFSNAFNDCDTLEEISFPKLKGISTDDFSRAFQNCEKLKKATFPEIERFQGFSYAFSGSGLEEIYLPKVKEFYYGGGYTFQDCKNLKVVSMPLLEKIDTNSFNSIFSGCTSLETLSFPSLITIPANGFGSATYSYAFRNCAALTEIHFRADMQATIEAMTGYADKWGATNATIYFDL